MTVLAHAGHWLVNLLYAAPVLAILGLLAWERLRGRRSGGAGRGRSPDD